MLTPTLRAPRPPFSQNTPSRVSIGMKTMRLSLFGLLTIALAIICTAATLRADDWPQWGGKDLGRNMVSTEKNLPDTFVPRSPTENVRWMATLGNYLQGNPTISGGRVFIG